MHTIKPNPIFKFNENHLQNVRNALGYGDINKLNQDIDHLLNWIQKENHFKVKEFDKEFLERLLIYNKGSVERTKEKFDRLCTCTNLMPEFLQNFDVKNEFKALYTISTTCFIPKPTKDNYRIIATTLTGVDDNDFKLIHYYRHIIVLGHYVFYHDYCCGFEFVVDLKHMTTGLVAKMNPIIVHKALTLVVEAMGQRIKKIHFVSGSKLFDAFMTIFKQGLSPKLKQRLMIHSNFDSLYEYVPKELLPKEFGGYEKGMQELNGFLNRICSQLMMCRLNIDLIFKEICTDEHIAQIKFMETIGTDETNRLPCKFNEEYSGMPGSFKILCVD